MSNYLQKSKQYKGFHYAVLPQESFDYLHGRTVEIFKQIKEVFEKNNIFYMVCGGTLLGAVTTGRFIPWDDDFDVCIFEKDYDRAIDLLIDKIPKDILVQCNKTEPRYFHGWVKVRDVNSKVMPVTESYNNNGVWVDLYKLTSAEQKEVEYKIAKEHLAYLKRRLKVKDITKAGYKKRLKENCVYNRIFKNYISLLFSKNKEEVYIIWLASKIVLKKEWVLPLKEYTFEDMKVTSFNSAENYLTAHYGKDFAKLLDEDLLRIGINNLKIIGEIQKYSKNCIPLFIRTKNGCCRIA